MPATITQIVEDAQHIIGQVAGTGVNEFAEDVLFKEAVRGFNMLFKRYYWEQYLNWYTFALDGTLGIPSTDVFASIVQLDFEDFIIVRRAGETWDIPKLPRNISPASLTSAGTKTRYWTSLHVTNANFANRRLQFYPVASTGSVNVLLRQYPLVAPATQFELSDTFHLDRDLLAYACAFQALSGDDLNPTALAVVRSLLDQRFNDIISGLAKHRIPISGDSGIPRDWFVNP